MVRLIAYLLLVVRAPYLVELHIPRFVVVDVERERSGAEDMLVGRLGHNGHHLGFRTFCGKASRMWEV